MRRITYDMKHSRVRIEIDGNTRYGFITEVDTNEHGTAVFVLLDGDTEDIMFTEEEAEKRLEALG